MPQASPPKPVGLLRLFAAVVAAGLVIGALAGLVAAKRAPGAGSPAIAVKASPSAWPLAGPSALSALNRLVRVA